MKKLIAIFFIFFLAHQMCFPKNRIKIGVLFGNYQIKDSRYKNIYGKNNFIYGGFLSYEILKRIDIRANFSSFSKTGREEYSDASFSFSPLSLSLRYQFSIKIFIPYLGVGIDRIQYKDKTPYYDLSDTKTGCHVESGIYILPFKYIIIDLNLLYRFIKTKPFEIEVDLGGIEFSIGLGIRL